MESWPSTLPLPRYNFSVSLVSNVIRSEIEVGYPEQRRVNSFENLSGIGIGQRRMFEVSFVFDETQMAAFLSFFNNSINEGFDKFTIQLNDISSTSYIARFVGGTYNLSKGDDPKFSIIEAELEVAI